MTEHSEKCLAEQKRANNLREEWIKKWPNFCIHCDAEGAVTVTDWVPYGSTNVRMDTPELCSMCTENDLCPRCGKELGIDWDEYYGDPIKCPHCGWDEENPDICPPGFEGPCLCMQEEFRDLYFIW